MSEHGLNNGSSNNQASNQALAVAIAAQIMQPIAVQFQAQEARFKALQSNLHTMMAGGAPQPVPPPAAPSNGPCLHRRASNTTNPCPDKTSENHMRKISTKIILWACGMEQLKDARLGLTPEQLQERMRTNPPVPWDPDWLKSINDAANKFWRDKMILAVLTDDKAIGLVDKGNIKRQFWTEDCLVKYILKPMWSAARREAKKLVDANAAARGRANHSKTNQDGCNKRLCKAQAKLATGNNTVPRLEYKIDGKMRHIPPELMVEEVMSNVVDDQAIPSLLMKVVLHSFAVESLGMKKNGYGIEARYYAGKITRGQHNNVDPKMAPKIPTSKLYRCHLSKEWFDRLSKAQRRVLKPSPAGWEVDEERVAVGTLQQ
ncbi:hypothetical protein RhiXN_07862 [Rhizoctonia solani]|uniref:Uncharacterized protein n=1 Tax=Rhizoctonia solani TaxID=456999 RepID=A0A8H8SY50_9AGAM|nr:uncharacterized protein RhiXN_07862 [Rhizoctonia solani]QRW22826.1 hypothetical protein RhiXN_07862 [Rhizoctonia solani]